MFLFLFFIVLFQAGSAIIFKVNEMEFNKMPNLYALDDYDRCLFDEGTYCIVDAELFSNFNSTLMSFITAYSEHKNKHFNHTQLHRGICVTQTCQIFLNKTEGLTQILAECLNESIWKDYKLETRISTVHYCKKSNQTVRYEAADYVIATIYLIIILLNVIGSFYESWKSRIGEKGNPYLLAFSIRRNWTKLGASCGEESERFKVFQGVRTLMMLWFIVSHIVFAIFHLYVDNPHSLEESYTNPINYLLINGMVVTAIFFVMSNFLLAYNFEISTEKTGVQWTQIPTGIILRWLRLMPVYALILATVATWMRHLGSGPLWDYVVTIESDSCREYWWMHILFINNFVYRNDKCLIHTWYLAADTQLFCIGLVICVVARTPRLRKIILSTLFVMSMIIVAAVTYFLNLDGAVLHYPETFRDLYASNETLIHLYLSPHTNLSSCAIGLTAGFLTYHWQKTKMDFTKLKKYGWLVWLILPLCALLVMSGALFSTDGSPPPMALRVAYAVFCKPLFQALMALLIISSIFKIDSVVRSITEWRGFSWTGKLTYNVFLVHICVLRALLGSETRPIHFSLTTALLYINATVFMSYAFAAVLWMFVEAPCSNLMQVLLMPREKDESEDKNAEAVQQSGTDGNNSSP